MYLAPVGGPQVNGSTSWVHGGTTAPPIPALVGKTYLWLKPEAAVGGDGSLENDDMDTSIKRKEEEHRQEIVKMRKQAKVDAGTAETEMHPDEIP